MKIIVPIPESINFDSSKERFWVKSKSELPEANSANAVQCFWINCIFIRSNSYRISSGQRGPTVSELDMYIDPLCSSWEVAGSNLVRAAKNLRSCGSKSPRPATSSYANERSAKVCAISYLRNEAISEIIHWIALESRKREVSLACSGSQAYSLVSCQQS